MKINFESNLDFQMEAIAAVTELFSGQEKNSAFSDFALAENASLDLSDGIGNYLQLTDEAILKNLQNVQKANGIAPSNSLENFNFAIEMETGTGKTYTYIRTIYELHKLYGFKKFLIVVPSIAIREGVLKNLQITHEHFQALYDKEPLNFQVYDSTRVSSLRGFASNNSIEILVINIDSFAKDDNVIKKANDRLSGHKPIEFIQKVKPIVILDEPQNMESEKRLEAISKLQALFTLRYSATHKNVYNLVYSLNPVRAYDLGLVKQIVVCSVVEKNSYNTAYIALESITAGKNKITANITIDCETQSGAKRKSIKVECDDNLYTKSGNREVYKDGFIIEEIDASENTVTFANGITIEKGQSRGGMNDEISKTQIRETIVEHLNKELKLRRTHQGVKVLSLFFIDRVANYRSYDESGTTIKGKFAQWFEEIYTELIAKEKYRGLNNFAVEQIHNGYFSQDAKGRVKDSNGETKADDDTYKLIMQNKEELLNIDNPLRFIFSHSALREGWDNPNVFQICTLNETKSEIKKRQEIGRGLRLAVDAQGMRIYDKNVNMLSVIANESYEEFAQALQTEIEEDCGISFAGRINNRDKKVEPLYRKGFIADPLFLALWEKIKHRTSYRVEFKTDKLIETASINLHSMPEITAPEIRIDHTGVILHENDNVSTIGGSIIRNNTVKVDRTSFGYPLPNILAYLQAKTELTRSTLYQILSKSGMLDKLLYNPQLFLELASKSINNTLSSLLLDGIKYQKIGNSEYAMSLFTDKEMEFFINEFTYKMRDKTKSIYESYIPLDSMPENEFAKDCESSEQVQFFFKLPHWFKIPTPIGDYNPDWALVFEGDKRIYFVAETKKTGAGPVDEEKLRDSERSKIECARAHFAQFANVEYRVVTRLGELVE